MSNEAKSLIMQFCKAVFALMLTISLPSNGWTQVKREFAPHENDTIIITAGQTFYTEFTSVPIFGVKLERPFRSSMAGAMGFPFSFEIMDTLLIPIATRGDGWRYYAPKGGAFKASHGLLGSVIRPGDSVGLRISPNDEAQWFVDNSVYNGSRTIWSRKIKKKDPGYVMTALGQETSEKHPIQRLIFLGVRDAQVRVRWDEFDPQFGQRSEEFSFPISNNASSVAIRGAKFHFSIIDAGAEVTVLTPMTDGVGRLKQ